MSDTIASIAADRVADDGADPSQWDNAAHVASLVELLERDPSVGEWTEFAAARARAALAWVDRDGQDHYSAEWIEDLERAIRATRRSKT